MAERQVGSDWFLHVEEQNGSKDIIHSDKEEDMRKKGNCNSW